MTEPSVQPAASRKARWLVWAFAALGVMTALAMIWLVVMLSGTGFRREPAVVKADKPGETYAVGSVEALAGTNLIAIEIESVDVERGYGSIKSGMGEDVRNVLLLDRNTGDSRRLLPDNRQQIASIFYLPAEAQTGNEDDRVAATGSGTKRILPPAYYLIQLSVKRGEKNSISLLVGPLAGDQPTTVMEGLDGVERRWMLDSRRLALIVREGSQLYFRVIDMIDHKVLQSRKIEIG